jgi:hypothetical protein
MEKTLKQKEALIKVNHSKRLTIQQFIDKAKLLHGEKFDYSQTVYKNATTKLTIICKIHGEQTMLPHHHTNNKSYGCAMCGKQAINRNKILTQEEFLNRVKNLEGLNFNKTIYKTKREKIIVTCNTHGDYSTTAEVLLKLCGCPKCKSSTGEDIIENILLKYNIQYNKQKTFKGLIFKKSLKFDFYLSEYNSCIEYDGEQHYKIVDYWGGQEGFNNLQLKDSLKNKYCEINNIPLLRIKFDNINIEETIKEFLQKNKYK